ncbi:putative CDP-alcohol phosphatidyltransferase class-I family protein C22A12.08c [Hypsizygus marmoreus]|uniref:CDP-alcohol phosphatidyltransferase class-I family protein C22A12.08c n=1 Tax=Hypsizygus marmoreus TaxID=39966 RepID=A0A369JTX0_HYPMA|nr:putative CDP-alcohol phosphatidyltransferase class-I family protein C22A12.08c [Hypsizygus marmoreus]
MSTPIGPGNRFLSMQRLHHPNVISLTKRCSRLQLSIPSILRRHIQQVSQKDVPAAPLAFVLDIDGVLLHGPKVLPAAKRALALLEGDNPFRTKIPYILLTNGGGVGEEERCQKLTQQLGIKISPSQYVQAHTILKSLSHKYADEPVLVLGGKLDAVRRVAEDYGYKKAFTTTDVLAWNPSVWPFHQASPAELDVVKYTDFSQTRVSAVFVFHDPRNWALDVQVLCDVLQSNGIVGGQYVSPEQQALDPVEVIFCNPDLLWRSEFVRPRLGQGAFKEAFQAIYKALTGSTYPHVQYGKPTEATYRFAEGVLSDYVEEIAGVRRPLPQVYMVGDNPESDIAGANAANWSSILVHTGVFDPQQGPPSHRPTHEVADVEAAVRWAIDRELARRP